MFLMFKPPGTTYESWLVEGRVGRLARPFGLLSHLFTVTGQFFARFSGTTFLSTGLENTGKNSFFLQ
jgi:hypothetical protein